MKNFPLVLILGVSIIFIVGINVRYLGHLGTHLDLEKVTVDDKPSRQVDDDNYKLPNKELTKQNIAPSESKLESSSSSSGTTGHRVAGLQCDKYGGPSEESAAEMIYWRDIPSDADFVSPYAKYGPTPKYLTFEPDEGGWNNIRMSMETATVLAHAMGRILVLPPEQHMYLLGNDKKKQRNKFTFRDFFHFDSIAEEHPAVQVISMEEFIQREGLTGHLKDKNSGEVTFPPRNQTTWNGHGRAGKEYWHWLRNATEAPKWAFDDCVVAFGKEAGPEGAKAMKEYRKDMPKKFITQQYVDNPTPVDAPPKDRMNEVLGDRRQLCVYGDHFQNVPVMHFMGDNASGARLLVHFYAYLYFEDWHQDLWTKRFVRDHLRYIDEIQCAAARIVHAVREKARENGDPTGSFDTLHIRRGDFQYKETRVDADEIYENVRDVLVENSTIFIATDEKNMAFFDPLRKHYHLYFLNDFMPLITDLNKNYYGMLDQRIASRGRTFVGAYFSTFTGYINRMRGYHSQKDKLAGYEKGELNSYYYTPKRNKHAMRAYRSVKAPMWSREFPIGWRDIDHDVAKDGVTPLSE